MTTVPERSPRRSDALSAARIVTAAITILDEGGASALTVRALTAALSTGRGAIYHHVTSMDALLAEAADHVIAQATECQANETDPRASLRAFSVAIFDAIDAHPWVGAQLSRDPSQPAVFGIWKSIGVRLQLLGLSGEGAADAGSALSSFILGATAQLSTARDQTLEEGARQAFLDALADTWASQDSDILVRDAARRLRDHDDRAQFLAGVDIFLAGIMSGS